ncbi:MAG: GIY-YIG nuclease family protein [Nitrososphaerota archaeon]|nr:GIY-YIG nuclease family protein [Nitrososphaerota archaeon]
MLSIDKKYNIEIGRRNFCLIKGIYAYVGSALNGINGRINRHLKTFMGLTNNMHWHIDYLLPKSNLLFIIYCHSDRRIECSIVKKLEELGFNSIKNFGNSDCKSNCQGHLIYLGNEIDKAMNSIKLAFSLLNLEYYLL